MLKQYQLSDAFHRGRIMELHKAGSSLGRIAQHWSKKCDHYNSGKNARAIHGKSLSEGLKGGGFVCFRHAHFALLDGLPIACRRPTTPLPFSAPENAIQKLGRRKVFERWLYGQGRMKSYLNALVQQNRNKGAYST
ncbi:Protein of unknown function [Gryllus bimaculatus]|nr:Protein of unknown function [Gryllus bimaculatus]